MRAAGTASGVTESTRPSRQSSPYVEACLVPAREGEAAAVGDLDDEHRPPAQRLFRLSDPGRMPGPLRFLRDQQSADRLHALARLEEADLHQPFILAPAHAACSNARHRSETIEPRAPGSMSDVRDSNAQPASSRSSGITQS